MSVAEIELLARERGLDYADLVAAVRALPPASTAVLSAVDAELLARLGIDASESSHVPALTGLLLRRQLEHESLTTAQAASQLGCTASRVRQRLRGPNRSLLGFRSLSGHHRWLIPRFQLEIGLHNRKGWGQLLQALPEVDLTSPTALVAWLTRPCSHLAGLSRATALTTDHDVDALVAEASTYGMPT